MVLQSGQAGCVERLVTLIDEPHDTLVNATLRLLVNLSFSPELREMMVKNGVIPKLVDLCKRSVHRDVVLKLLYHISMDDRCKSMFTYTDAIPLVCIIIMGTEIRAC